MQDPTTPDDDRDRGQIQLVDVLFTFYLFVAIMVVAPVIYTFTGMAASQADPFTQLLLQLVVPILFIAALVSVSVSARKGGL